MANYFKICTLIVMLAFISCYQSDNQFEPNQNTLKDNNEVELVKTDLTNNNQKVVANANGEEDEENLDSRALNFWINFRYNMEFQSNQPKKTAILYHPEKSDYMTTLRSYAWFSYLLGAIFGLLFFMYLIGRFILGKFKGPKVLLNQTYTKVSLVILILSAITVIVLLGLSVNKINKV